MPQPPQFFTSLSVCAQPEPQQTSPALHTVPLQAQLPFEQASGGPHTRPHIPQLALSFIRSAHACAGALPQQTSGELHEVEPHGQVPSVEQPA